jgi:hypothetical protein
LFDCGIDQNLLTQGTLEEDFYFLTVTSQQTIIGRVTNRVAKRIFKLNHVFHDEIFLIIFLFIPNKVGIAKHSFGKSRFEISN